MALLNFADDSPTSFYLPETGASAADVCVLENDGAPDLPISLLPLGLARRVASAYELVKRERPRIIHAWNDLPGIVAAFAGLLAGCPRIFIHFHHMRAINLSDDRNLVRSYPACYRRLLERADDYADWWSVQRTSQFRRLFNGFVDVPAGQGMREIMRRDLGFASQAPVVGAVFRFDRVKRPWLWVDVARHVQQKLPDARFVMVGGGAEMDRTMSRVGDYGLNEHFHFAGQVRNVPDYLACFDLFLLTSRIEGLPNSLVEAQLAGVPVVTTDVGGARETFIPGVTGQMVAGDSPQLLGDAVVRCLSDQAWRDRAAAKSRPSALDRFGIGRYLQSLMAIYGENP
jgi:glycosyltransferase involved in cell wall biosynthesis